MVTSAVLARCAQRRQNVRRTAGGRQRQQHVAAPAEALDLAREHLLEAVIVGDRGQRRGVGGQRDRGVAGPILLVAADDFGGDMLGVGGAAAIADDQELVGRSAAPRSMTAAILRAAASSAASCVARSKAASDSSKCAADRIFRSPWLKTHRQDVATLCLW